MKNAVNSLFSQNKGLYVKYYFLFHFFLFYSFNIYYISHPKNQKLIYLYLYFISLSLNFLLKKN